MNINSTNGLYPQSQTASLQKTNTPKISQASVKEPIKLSDDTVSISSKEKINTLLGNELLKNIITIDDIKASIESDRKYLNSRLEFYREKYSISSDNRVELTANTSGGIVVKGKGDLSGLQNALNNDEDFRNTFMRMSANTSLEKAAERHIEFTKAYEKDPEAAVKMYSYLFDGSRNDKVSLVSENGDSAIKVTELFNRTTYSRLST